MTLFPLLTVLATSSSTIIPITFTPNPPMELQQVGVPMINAEFGGRYGGVSMRPHVVHLGTVGQSLPSYDGETRSGSFHYPQLRIQTANVSMMSIARPRHHRIDSYGGTRRNAIGIGPGSDLLRVGGPIDFVRQSSAEGVLRVGGSEDNFIANDCLSDSVMRMATGIASSIRDYSPTVQVETRVSVALADNVIRTRYVAILDSDRFLLTMPHTWMANIFEAVSPYFDQMLPGTVFPGCNNMIHRLPTITLTFSAGGLRLVPEDYTRPIGNDTCELLVGRMPDRTADQTIRFNPLLIPGINARSTENEIILCDSAINL